MDSVRSLVDMHIAGVFGRLKYAAAGYLLRLGRETGSSQVLHAAERVVQAAEGDFQRAAQAVVDLSTPTDLGAEVVLGAAVDVRA